MREYELEDGRSSDSICSPTEPKCICGAEA